MSICKKPLESIQRFFALGLNDNRCTDGDERKKLLYIGIVQADAALRYVTADGPGLVGAVNAVARTIEPQPASPKRSRIGEDFFVDDMPVAHRCGRLAFADGDGAGHALSAVLIEC